MNKSAMNAQSLNPAEASLAIGETRKFSAMLD